MGNRMNAFARALMFTAILLGGCRATRDVAVSSYHVTRDVAVGSYRVATAPVHYALRRSRGDTSTMDAASVETVESDVNQPGYPVTESETASAQQPPPRIERSRVPSESPTAPPRVARKEPPAQSKTKPSSSSGTSSAQPEFPTAKLVPGKPGYVISPFDSSGRYVDISGYTSGSKVKDPWTNKIFIVP
jgi:hypothetical protein